MKDKCENNRIDSVCDSLSRESIELIDFDEVKSLLQQYQLSRKDMERTQTELDYIKNEYRSRIYGMLKAVMACRHNAENAEILTSLSTELGEIESAALVKLYRRVTAKFRSCFPGSFKYLTPLSTVNRKENWEEFKI
jgi:DNA-binding protein YbaB